MHTSDELTAFITARLDEDEAIARHAGPARIAWLTLCDSQGQLRYTTVAAASVSDDVDWLADGKVIPDPADVRVVYDPARALREVVAIRTIVTEHNYDKRGCDSCEYPEYCPVPRLATIWSDHPDYKQEWTP